MLNARVTPSVTSRFKSCKCHATLVSVPFRECIENYMDSLVAGSIPAFAKSKVAQW